MNIPDFSWFDGVAILFFVSGAWRGWRNGFAWELPRLVKWFLVAGLGILVTNPAAEFASRLGLAFTYARILMFGLLTTLIVWTFIALLRGAGEKLHQTGSAGQLEHGAGLTLGILRYGLILLVLVGVLAMAPVQQGRFAIARENILNGSFTGGFTRPYWRQLAPEYDLPPLRPGSPPPLVVSLGEPPDAASTWPG
ncbi:MAG: CvpA family protein [Verrucomicrobiales bacterium]|nr:CvpA family protein [Verrucomicrobiales bacterium]MCP5527475.1 CvpA family protein [Verrucomicrobiales bacterium]